MERDSMRCSKNYMYPGFYPGIIQVNSNKKIPFAEQVGVEFPNPLVSIALNVSRRDLPDAAQYPSQFEYVSGKFGGHDVYCDFSLMRGVSMKFRLQDLESSNPKMTVAPISWSMMKALEVASRAYRYLLDVQTLALLLHGHYPLHCSAISTSGTAALIIAPGKTGKTCAALRAVQHGYKMIAEERVVSDGYNLYPGMLAGAKIYSGLYMAKVAPQQNRLRRLTLKMMRSLGLDNWKNICASVNGCVTISQHQCETEVVKVSHIVFLERGTHGVSSIAREEAARRLHANNKAEFTWRSDTLLHAYSYFNPDFDFRALERAEDAMLDRLLECCSLHVCSTEDPLSYYDQIDKVMRA